MCLSGLPIIVDYSVKTPQQLGAVLRGFRRERQLTQAEAGARVGLAQNAVSEIESNPARSSVERVLKLLAALEVDVVLRPRRQEGKQADW